MKLIARASALLALEITNVNAHAIYKSRRDIPNVGHHTSKPPNSLSHNTLTKEPVRGNISSIASWTLAALAYGSITASNTSSELGYLCENFNQLSSRYSAAFSEPSGDMSKFAREAICSASKVTDPSPEPLAQNNIWYMKSYLAASFVIQGYNGNLLNSSYYANMCWYLESSLLQGLWAPCGDTDESGVDVESSFCASAGYYGKEDYFRYTNATQATDGVREADRLVTTLMGRVLKLLLSSEQQFEYLCRNFARYEPGIRSLGLVSQMAREEVCGNGGVVELGVAKQSLLAAMTNLFGFQLLMGGECSGLSKIPMPKSEQGWVSKGWLRRRQDSCQGL